MKKVKVAIIDSGISEYLINKQNLENRVYTPLQKYDKFGHGTQCFCIIDSIIKYEVDYIIIKILDDFGATIVANLATALQDLIEADIDILNMSLAINEPIEKDKVDLINKLCDVLSEKGIIITCSYKNRMKTSYSASISSVFGVRGAFYQLYSYQKGLLEK